MTTEVQFPTKPTTPTIKMRIPSVAHSKSRSLSTVCRPQRLVFCGRSAVAVMVERLDAMMSSVVRLDVMVTLRKSEMTEDYFLKKF